MRRSFTIRETQTLAPVILAALALQRATLRRLSALATTEAGVAAAEASLDETEGAITAIVGFLRGDLTVTLPSDTDPFQTLPL